MASNNKLCATLLVFSILFHFSTFISACGICRAKPKPPPPPPVAHCPKDTLKLGICLDILGLGSIPLGNPISSKCCSLLQGLTDLEAAVCLCTTIKANVLGINLDVPVTLSLLISACQKSVPPGFQCA